MTSRFLTAVIFFAIVTICPDCPARAENSAYPKLPHKELVFVPGQGPISHSPSIVELPNGDLFAVWYAVTPGTNNSSIWSAKRPSGANKWTKPAVIHSTKGHSTKNPVLYLGRDNRLFLFWSDEGRWFKIVIDRLRMKVSEDLGNTWGAPRDMGAQGFIPKNHPIRLENGRIVLPIYADWNTSSAAIYSQDDGETWSRPSYILFLFGIQPTIIQRSDLSLYALMRSGMPPRLAWEATSADMGKTWKNRKYSTVNNPGTSLEILKLRNGHVVKVSNDSKTSLSGLSIALSLDEGRSWPYVRMLEFKADGRNTYPSVLQDKNGLIHALYSYDSRTSIGHFVTNEEWIRSGK